MRVKLLLVIASFIPFYSCILQPTSEIQKAEWLIGTWEYKTPKGSLYEAWKKVNDHEFAGKSYILKEKDSVVLETMRLSQEQDGLFYIPTVKNQNMGLPVRFRLKASSDTAMVFENPEHDYPQFISYSKIGSDSLVAEISGTKNGELRKQSFPMKQIK